MLGDASLRDPAGALGARRWQETAATAALALSTRALELERSSPGEPGEDGPRLVVPAHPTAELTGIVPAERGTVSGRFQAVPPARGEIDEEIDRRRGEAEPGVFTVEGAGTAWIDDDEARRGQNLRDEKAGGSEKAIAITRVEER